MSTQTTPRRPLSFEEAAAAHRAMTDAIRIVAMYADRERDAGNKHQAGALARLLARLTTAQRPLCESAQSYHGAPSSAAGIDHSAVESFTRMGL